MNTQKNRVLEHILSVGGAIPREDLQRWGLANHISDADRRAREMIKDNRLYRRTITADEKICWGYKMDVIVYALNNLTL